MAKNKTLTYDLTDHNGSIRMAEALSYTIKGSREYQEYLAAYNKMSEDEIEKLREFKHIESQIPQHNRLGFDEEKRISNLYALLTLNANIKTFIEKEHAVCGMLNRVFNIIGDIHLFMFDD